VRDSSKKLYLGNSPFSLRRHRLESLCYRIFL